MPPPAARNGVPQHDPTDNTTLSESPHPPRSSSVSPAPPSDGEAPLPTLAPPTMFRSMSSSGVPSGPPSRPTTSMSNASSIDDLLGPPVARKGGTSKKPKRGRGYIDVMAK